METDFVLYDPWLRRKVPTDVAASHAIAAPTISDDMPIRWVHNEDEDK